MVIGAVKCYCLDSWDVSTCGGVICCEELVCFAHDFSSVVYDNPSFYPWAVSSIPGTNPHIHLVQNIS